MGWEEHFITLYLRICKEYKESLCLNCQRFTNGGCKAFTDEEVMVVYLIGVLRGFKNVKALHCYASAHLSSWFPALPQYAAFVHSLALFCLSSTGFSEVIVHYSPFVPRVASRAIN